MSILIILVDVARPLRIYDPDDLQLNATLDALHPRPMLLITKYNINNVNTDTDCGQNYPFRMFNSNWFWLKNQFNDVLKIGLVSPRNHAETPYNANWIQNNSHSNHRWIMLTQPKKKTFRSPLGFSHRTPEIRKQRRLWPRPGIARQLNCIHHSWIRWKKKETLLYKPAALSLD